MLEIKPAAESDAQILTELGRAKFIETFAKENRKEDVDLYVTETFRLEKQLSEIKDSKRRISIAWFQNQPAGCLHLRIGNPDPSVTGEKPIEILRLYVHSKWHGKGVGAALMEKCLQISSDEGFKTIWLGVWERNLRAEAFYKKQGFATVGKHLFRVGTDDQTDLIMARPL